VIIEAKWLGDEFFICRALYIKKLCTVSLFETVHVAVSLSETVYFAVS